MADIVVCLPSKPPCELVRLLAHSAYGETEARGFSNLPEVTLLGSEPIFSVCSSPLSPVWTYFPDVSLPSWVLLHLER